MLSNRLGSFYLYTGNPYSKYCGCFFSIGGKIYKCLESVDPNSPIQSTEDFHVGINNQREGFMETIYMPEGMNALGFRYSQIRAITVTLDIREANDFDDWGRHYSITEEQGCIIVKYIKTAGGGDEKYTLYLAIRSLSQDYEQITSFREVEYEYDRFRNSGYRRNVYDALRLKTASIAVSMSDDMQAAIDDAKKLFAGFDAILSSDNRYRLGISPIIEDERIKQAYKLACVSMHKLMNDAGIYAGLPWFFQCWSRDELISLKFLIDRSDLKLADAILSKYTSLSAYTGFLPAIYPDQGNRSADAIGWLFLRLSELMDKCDEAGMAARLYPDKRRKALIEGLDRMLFALFKYQERAGMISSGKDETWMDTSTSDDERAGFCIEIQALVLRALSVMHELTKDSQYKEREELLRANVLSRFAKRNTLIDCISADMKEQESVRPNVFIAYYAYPWLLDSKSWESVFDLHLAKLWLDWGGVSTLDRSNPNFIDTYTGENNLSYHRGDSWYYLNCMAAICMHRLNRQKYMHYIDSIIAACCAECLENGVIGSIAELSSAKERTGYGCLSQAWSLAMFIELIDLVYAEEE